VSRLLDLHRRATSRRETRPPLALTHPISSASVLAPLLGVAAAMVAGLWALETWLLEGPTPWLDERGLEWATDQRTPEIIAAARVVTHLGDLWVVIVIAAVLVWLARRRSGRWDSAVLVVTVIGGVLVITTVAKLLTARPRPDEALTDTVSLAFPSGHASRAAVAYAMIAWLAVRWAKHPVTRHLVAVLAVVMTLATAGSRVLLGAHWPTDVMAGMTLGAIWLAVVVALTRPAPAELVDEGARDGLTDDVAEASRPW
jgi:membrane-associated phospholipid phosphatase